MAHPPREGIAGPPRPTARPVLLPGTQGSAPAPGVSLAPPRGHDRAVIDSTGVRREVTRFAHTSERSSS